MHGGGGARRRGKAARRDRAATGRFSPLARHDGASRHLAFDLWRVGDLPGAIAALRDAFAASPPTAAARIQLGTYLGEAGQTGAAIELLKQAVATEPNLDALNALGIAYARHGRAAEALATFTRSLEIDPGNAMTFENIGAVHLDAGRLSDARQAFERATRPTRSRLRTRRPGDGGHPPR